jgi:hypothetical protein
LPYHLVACYGMYHGFIWVELGIVASSVKGVAQTPRLQNNRDEGRLDILTQRFTTSLSQVGIRRCYAGYLQRKMLLIFYAICGRAEQMNNHRRGVKMP